VPMATKADGIQAARMTLKTAVFHPRCEEKGIAALEQYRRKWDDERKMFAATEERDWSTHLADAFRYSALVWRETPKPKPTPIRKDELIFTATPTGTVSNLTIREIIALREKRRKRDER